MAVSNDTELTILLQKIATDVIEKVSESILSELKEIIKSDVYGSHGPNKIYPTMTEDSEFLNAFEWDKISKSVKTITTIMFYNWKQMSVNPDIYQHSSYADTWGDDTRAELAGYLNITGKKGVYPNLFMSVDRKPYWDRFISKMFGQSRINQLFDKEFSSRKIYRI